MCSAYHVSSYILITWFQESSNSAEGFDGSGQIIVLSHFAVVIAVLTGVTTIFEVEEWWGESGLVIVFTGEANESNFLCMK